MKLLRGQAEKVNIKERIKMMKNGELSDGPEVSISFEVEVVDSALQARLLDLSRFVYSQEGKQRYIACQLKQCISGDVFTVNDADMKASDWATMADFTDPETAGILAVISREIDKHVFTQAEDEKK